MLIHRTRVFDLYSADVACRNTPFEFILHRGSCAALLVSLQSSRSHHRSEIGLLLHDRPTIGKRLYEIPAGTIDYNRPVEQIMVDELRDETGLEIDRNELEELTSAYASPGYTSELLTLFAVHLSAAQRGQCEHLHWFDLDRIEEMIQNGHIADLKTVAAISLFQWRKHHDRKPKRRTRVV